MSIQIISDLIKKLKEVGLKQNESEVYLFLLQNGISTPPAISKGTNIARTNCYNILNSLKEKDTIDEQIKGKKKAYIARDPRSLRLSLERKIEGLERLVPDLEAMHTTQKNKPLFKFYDGWEDVKIIYELSLKAEKIYALGSTEKLISIDKDFFEKYVKNIKKNNIIFQDILTSECRKSSELIKSIENKEYSFKFLPPEYSENITDILVWEDNIALISLEDPIFGTIITSKPLSGTLRTIFNFIWNKT